MKWYQSSIAFVIVFLFAIGAPQLIADSDQLSETETELSEFLIIIERSGEEINLICKEGCVFEELGFSKYFNFWNLFTFSSPQAINQSGMANLKSNKTNNDQSEFLFTIKNQNGAIQLEGIKGTAWKSLNFNCPENDCRQAIDEHGMTTIE